MTNPVAGLRFNSWSASRLDDYTLCPRKAAHKHLQKLCPRCFKGKLVGYPVAICNHCKQKREASAAMERGGAVGRTLELYVKGEADAVHEEIVNKPALTLAKKLRAAYAKGKVSVESTINLDRNWKVLPPQWSPSIWLIVKLDVWQWTGSSTGRVIDWKTGGVNKNTGQIYANEKYDDQLLAYQVASLVAFPRLNEVHADLCFVDAKGDPMVTRPSLTRINLPAAQKKLTKLSIPIMTDDTFAPKPNDKCRWCEYGKTNSGPCPF